MIDAATFLKASGNLEKRLLASAQSVILAGAVAPLFRERWYPCTPSLVTAFGCYKILQVAAVLPKAGLPVFPNDSIRWATDTLPRVVLVLQSL